MAWVVTALSHVTTRPRARRRLDMIVSGRDWDTSNDISIEHGSVVNLLQIEADRRCESVSLQQVAHTCTRWAISLSSTVHHVGCILSDHVTVAHLERYGYETRSRVLHDLGDIPSTYFRPHVRIPDHRLLQVEDCLFRVPNHTLTKQSKFFEEMLQYVTSDNNHPIPLDGVTADEFRRLLRVLYPRHVGIDPSSPSVTNLSVYIAVPM